MLFRSPGGIAVAVEFEVAQAQGAELLGDGALRAVHRSRLRRRGGGDQAGGEGIGSDVVGVVGAEEAEGMDAERFFPACRRHAADEQGEHLGHLLGHQLDHQLDHQGGQEGGHEQRHQGKGDGRRGRGVAYARYKTVATYAAVIAEVEVNRATGSVRVPRIWIAADAGQIINPDGLTNQIEGGVIQSTSWTLKESVRYDSRRVQTRSWADYPILTFAEVPAVDVVLLNRPDEKSLGAGEGSQGPTVAAIANAVANATGVRIRELPFTPDRVKSALA